MRFLIETISSTGLSFYAVCFNPDGTVWNTTLNAGAGGWEAYNSGHWSAYAIPLTEKSGSGYYSAEYPEGIADVLTTEVIYSNETPTLGDQPMGIAQSQGSNIAAVAGDAAVAATFQASLSTMVLGAIIAGTLTTTSFSTDITNTEINAFRGRTVLFATGDLAGQGGVISEYDPDTGVITVTGAFSTPPSVADVFVIA